MALSNADNPLAEKPKPAPKAEPKSEPVVAPVLARASTTSDPAVHSLLANRQTAVRNGNAAAVAAADKALAGLGYAV